MAPSAAACTAAFATRLRAIRISVRPAAETCATMNAINASVHSTTIRAKPRFRRQGAGDGNPAGIGSNGHLANHMIGGDLPQLTLLPELELPEELVPIFLTQRRAAGRLLALFDEAREDRFEILQVGSWGHPSVPLQPLLRRREAPPARKLGRDVDFAPLRMMARLQQRLEPGK